LLQQSVYTSSAEKLLRQGVSDTGKVAEIGNSARDDTIEEHSAKELTLPQTQTPSRLGFSVFQQVPRGKEKSFSWHEKHCGTYPQNTRFPDNQPGNKETIIGCFSST
jgi:hypothetical protein